MSIYSLIKGRVRGLFLDLLPANNEDQMYQTSGQAELLVSYGAAPHQEYIRQGHSFCANTIADIAAVTALPAAQVAAFAIYNNEADGGRSYVIDRVWAMYTTNGTAAVTHTTILGLLGQVRETAPADARPANGLQCLSGGTNYDTKVLIVLASATALPTTTGIVAYWKPMGTSINSVVASLPGFQQVYEVNGRIIVPPGRYFALHTISTAVTVEAQLGVEWTEKVLKVI